MVYQCAYHVIWCPKYLRSVLSEEIGNRLREIVEEVAAERDAVVVEMEVMPDHVHMLVEVDPQYGIHRLIKQFKGCSSRLLREEFPTLRSRLPTLWTNSYYVSTVGAISVGQVRDYIADQKGR